MPTFKHLQEVSFERALAVEALILAMAPRPGLGPLPHRAKCAAVRIRECLSVNAELLSSHECLRLWTDGRIACVLLKGHIMALHRQGALGDDNVRELEELVAQIADEYDARLQSGGVREVAKPARRRRKRPTRSNAKPAATHVVVDERPAESGPPETENGQPVDAIVAHEQGESEPVPVRETASRPHKHDQRQGHGRGGPRRTSAR
jgi:hypothetical protein